MVLVAAGGLGKCGDPSYVRGVQRLAANDGLVCAFRLGASATRLDDVLAGGPPGDEPLWLHFNLANARARQWLKERDWLPEEAREELLSAETRIHSEVCGDGFIAVLGDMDHDAAANPDGFHPVRVYVDAERIVSTRLYPLKSLDGLRRELAAGGAELPTPVAVFERLVELLAENVARVVARLGDEVDDAEDEVLAGRFGRQGEALARMRRSLARLRRQVNANRAALAPLPRRLPEHYDADQRQGLRQAVERLDAVAQDLDLVQERARLVQEEIGGRLAEATNRNLFILSIVTTTLLPITLITGIFGMNVGGLPWLSSGSGFWWVMSIIVAAIALTLLLLRSRRVL